MKQRDLCLHSWATKKPNEKSDLKPQGTNFSEKRSERSFLLLLFAQSTVGLPGLPL